MATANIDILDQGTSLIKNDSQLDISLISDKTVNKNVDSSILADKVSPSTSNFKVDNTKDFVNLNKDELLKIIFEKESLIQGFKQLFINIKNESNSPTNNVETTVNVKQNPVDVVSVQTHSPEWLPLVGGNPISMIPNFYGDPNNRNEAERFINALKNISFEYRWSEFKTRSILESKLQQKARTRYFDGLGCDDNINIEVRMKEFLRLFSRKPKEDEGQDLFLKCVQDKDENVISFKLRLVGLSEPLKLRLRNNSDIYEDFLVNQFRRGLIPSLRIEVLKNGSRKFDELVDFAINIEECLKLCFSKTTNLNVLSDSSEFKKLDKKIQELSSKLFELEEEQEKSFARKCRYCGTYNMARHIEQMCYRNISRSNIDGWTKVTSRKNKFPYYNAYNNNYYQDNKSSYKNMNNGKGNYDQSQYKYNRGVGIPPSFNKYQLLPSANDNNLSSITPQSSTVNSFVYNNKKPRFHKSNYRSTHNDRKSNFTCKGSYNQSNPNSKQGVDVPLSSNSYQSIPNANDNNSLSCNTPQSKDVKQNFHKGRKQSQVVNQNVNKSINQNIDKFYDNLENSRFSKRPQVIVKHIDKYYTKPIIKVKIFGRDIYALVDTGAEVTVVDSNFFKSNDPLKGHRETTLSSAVSDCTIIGYYSNVDMNIGGTKFIQNVCIAPIDGGGEYHMLMGYDMIVRHQIICDPINRQVKFSIDLSKSWTSEFEKLKIGHISTCKFLHVNNTDLKLIDPPIVKKEDSIKTSEYAISNHIIRDAQLNDEFCKSIINNISLSINKDNSFSMDKDNILVKQISTINNEGGNFKKIVPTHLRDEIISFYTDNTSDVIISAPKIWEDMKEFFTWEKMYLDIKEHVEEIYNHH